MKEIRQIKIFRCRSIRQLEKSINKFLSNLDSRKIDNITIRGNSILEIFIWYNEEVEDEKNDIKTEVRTDGIIDINDEWYQNLKSNYGLDKEKDEFNDEFSNRYLQGKEDTPLNDIQKKFVVEYAKSGDARNAAIKSGYHERFDGNNLLGYKKIVKAVREERTKMKDKDGYTDIT